MNKKFREISAFLTLLCLTNFCSAGSSVSLVKNYTITTYGKFFFNAGDQASRAACSNGDWAVDLTGTNASAGKAIMAAVIAASAQGKTIYVTGAGTCDVWGDRETVLYITVGI